MSNYTNFTNSDLTNIQTFNNANLSYATFTGSILTNTDLSNAILTGIVSGSVKIILDSIIYYSINSTTESVKPLLPANWSLINGYLVGPKADLTNALLADTSSDLTQNLRIFEADFTGADLTNVDFTGSSLSKCIFSGANLSGTNFTNCNLKNCIFTGAIINSTTLFTNTNLSGIITGGITNSLGSFITTIESVDPANSSYNTQLPTGFVFNNGYIVGPGTYLFNARLIDPSTLSS